MNRQQLNLLRRLERQAALWREEPMRRVAVRNKLLRPLRSRQFYRFGEDSIVDRPLWLYGARHISIGAGVIILRNGWLAAERPAWDREAPALTIGDGVAIRVGCTISAAESVVIEPNVGMGAYCTVIDSKHTWGSESTNALYGALDTQPVRIGRGTWMADRVTIAAGADIGEHCSIGPNSVVGGTVPDFSIVMGNPARVVGSTRT